MQIVGIDFGTTNIRISTWDSDEPDLVPDPQTMGAGESKIMPAVVAFRQQQSGEVDILVGDDAEGLEVGTDQKVFRNLKRCALASDPYVRQRLTNLPEEWDSETRCLSVFGREYSIRDLISRMLKHAFDTAGISPGFEWVAGCPVHAGLEYRADLAEIVTELGGAGAGALNRIVEEPILALVAAYRLGRLQAGSSYLVYDLGGGSFDCALAQIEGASSDTDDLAMVVYGARGDPGLGGSDIDDFLKAKLEVDDRDIIQLRGAKEAVRPTNLQQPLPGNKTLSWTDVEEAVKQLLFLFKTTVTMRESYRDAKVVWNRKDENAPVGRIVSRNPNTRGVRFVDQLNWEDLIEDVDGVILCGGPTKSPIFSEALRKRFGEEKVIAISDLIPAEIPDPELTAISVGACYAIDDPYRPLYVNRLPVRIELEDLLTGDKVEYEPYTHFERSLVSRANNFVTERSLTKQANDPASPIGGRYELTVTRPNVNVPEEQLKVDSYINGKMLNFGLRLVVNRLGLIGVEQRSANSAPHEYPVITEGLPWQTNSQRRAIAQLRENARRQQEQSSANFDRIQRDTLWM